MVGVDVGVDVLRYLFDIELTYLVGENVLRMW